MGDRLALQVTIFLLQFQTESVMLLRHLQQSQEAPGRPEHVLNLAA